MLKKNLRRTYARIPWLLRDVFTPAPRTIEALLQTLCQREKRIRFLQVGANDGHVNDNIHKLLSHTQTLADDVHGTCLEPQKVVFQDLLETYASYPNVACYNVALSDTDEQRTLYNLHPKYQNSRKRGGFGSRLASFNREHIIKHWQQCAAPDQRAPLPGTYICAEQVDCMTFHTFATKAGVKTFDILMIDTEGFDAEILKMIDLDRYQVKAVVLEHKHLTRQEKSFCYHKLKKAGFVLGGSSKDLWGLRP